MIRLLQSSWVAAGIGAVLFLVTAAAVLNPRKLLRARQAQITASAKKPTPHAGWDFSNPEIDQLIAELKMEKEGLALREQQLKELATLLAAERSEINQTTQAVNRLEKEFDERIVRVREEETANLKKLAKTYAAMSPEGAATILKQMEDDQIVKILVFIKEGDSAPILEAFAKSGEADAKRVAMISERVRVASFRNQILKTTAP
jgi:flagellar motility protein MotE (MotC chaperone)